MKLQIFEALSGGHHSEFIARLLPILIELREQGRIQEIVVTVSRGHYESVDFQKLLRPFLGRVTFDVGADIEGFTFGSAWRIMRMLLQSIKRNRPDVLIATSANYGGFPLALRRAMNLSFGPPSMLSIGIFHHSDLTGDRSSRGRMRAAIHRFARNNAPWTEVQLINPLLFESLRTRPAGEHPFRLVPSPVDFEQTIDRGEARRRLNLPVDGWYLGHIGDLDARIALPDLLRAFRAAALPASYRLLLSGRLWDPYRKLLDEGYADMIADQRIIVRDAFVSPEEVIASYSAINVTALPYYANNLLSGKAIQSLSLHRPILASSDGYTGMLIRDFGAGWGITVGDQAMLVETIVKAAKSNDAFTITPQAERLIAFHQPENYADSVLSPLYEQMGWPQPNVHSWSWVRQGASNGTV